MVDKDSALIQKKLQTELEHFKAAQKDFNKLVQQRQLLDGQLNENKNVMEELNLLKPENKVYKLYGPVLVRQELEECRQNVGKRIEYINKELKRCQDSLTTLEKKQDKHRENLQKLQQQYQVAIAMK
ncbi:probable prefoldin subunit 6 [Phlebotomus argentipes]|uniref:probable prefoldin subunit 6 n=1 Tax=Phlebotomus argentipes TaxID=94469 RepID=UPI0028936831|nr:probable prefoldin subunit 6 [Phlebotomus argentipes]